MKRVLGLTAVGCSIAFVEAGSFKWNANNRRERRWEPAYPTLGVKPLLGSSPAPTSPPRLAEARQNKRSATDNTCAYVSGDPDDPLYCNVDSACVYNSQNSNIGCCPETSTTCAIWTTCLDSTDASLYTTDNGYTLWCGQSEYPYCKTHLYNDNLFSGYTLHGCAVAAGTDSVAYSATLSSSSSSSSSGQSSVSSSGLETSLNVATTGISSARVSSVASTTSGSPPTTTNTTPAASSGGSSTPIGAIVGGVVGGIAVIALFALGLVFLLRRRRRNAGPNSGPNAQQASFNQSGGYPPQPPPSQPLMQQQYQQPNFQQPPADHATGYAAAPMDNRSSIQKPGGQYNTTHSVYDPSMASPPASPPPQGQSPGSVLPAYQVSNTSTGAGTQPGPPPTDMAYGAPQHQGTGPGVTQAHQNSGQPVYQQHSENNYYEMSTDPADRELRELA